MKKILFIFGTRPEAIKMAPVIRVFMEHPFLEPVVCLTGQHREMLHQILPLFDIKTDYDLDLMTNDQSLESLTARAIDQISSVIRKVEPDWVIVQGDTTTTFCGGLAAYYNAIPVAHIEAGLRTGDIYAPFPEEMNRILTSHLSTVHFAPTDNNRNNLLREGIPDSNIHVTGNTVIDALQWVSGYLDKNLEVISNNSLLSRLQRKFILVTGHRRESFGEGFESICRAIRKVAIQFPDIDIVYPVHLNPHVREPVNRILGNIDNIILIEPQDYEIFVALMKRCYFILTDSGGVQEEGPSLGKPVLVMREKTERQEGLSDGVRLVGNQEEKIFTACQMLLQDKQHYQSMSVSTNPYGDGSASKKIADVIASMD